MSEENSKSKPETPPSAAAAGDIDRTPVAKEIWCYSTKEKTFTWHVVVNHDAKGFVDRVQCKTSGVIHKYKKQSKTTTSAKKPSTRKVAPKAPVIDVEAVWHKGVKNWGDKVVKNYTIENFYSPGEVIEHSSFGKGVVQGRRDNKIDTLFLTGMKTLVSIKK